MSPFVTVIIPVFNDAQGLQRCLTVLEQQTYAHDRYEVVVVDNGSDSEPAISTVVNQFKRAIVVHELQPGSYAARNRGIESANGEVIAFTDADCVPTPTWLETGVKTLLSLPNIGLVAGRVDIFFKDANQPTAIELYESITAFPQAQLLEDHKGAATANLFTWKAVFDSVGRFNANLKARGDLEWGKRVFLAGYVQVYAEDVCVHHPARQSFDQLYRRTIRMAGGIYDLQNQQQSFFTRNFAFFKGLMLDLVPPLMFVMNTFQDSRLQRIDQKVKVSFVMFFVRYITAWEKFRLKAGAISARE